MVCEYCSVWILKSFYKQAGWEFLINMTRRTILIYVYESRNDSLNQIPLLISPSHFLPQGSSPILIKAVVYLFLFSFCILVSIDFVGITELFTYFIYNLAEGFCHLYFPPFYKYFLTFSTWFMEQGERIKGFGPCSVFIQPEFHFSSCRFVDCVVFADVHFP